MADFSTSRLGGEMGPPVSPRHEQETWPGLKAQCMQADRFEQAIETLERKAGEIHRQKQSALDVQRKAMDILFTGISGGPVRAVPEGTVPPCSTGLGAFPGSLGACGSMMEPMAAPPSAFQPEDMLDRPVLSGLTTIPSAPEQELETLEQQGMEVHQMHVRMLRQMVTSVMADLSTVVHEMSELRDAQSELVSRIDSNARDLQETRSQMRSEARGSVDSITDLKNAMKELDHRMYVETEERVQQQHLLQSSLEKHVHQLTSQIQARGIQALPIPQSTNLEPSVGFEPTVPPPTTVTSRLAGGGAGGIRSTQHAGIGFSSPPRDVSIRSSGHSCSPVRDVSFPGSSCPGGQSQIKVPPISPWGLPSRVASNALDMPGGSSTPFGCYTCGAGVSTAEEALKHCANANTFAGANGWGSRRP